MRPMPDEPPIEAHARETPATAPQASTLAALKQAGAASDFER
jgi:hypothetical protein